MDTTKTKAPWSKRESLIFWLTMAITFLATTLLWGLIYILTKPKQVANAVDNVIRLEGENVETPTESDFFFQDETPTNPTSASTAATQPAANAANSGSLSNSVLGDTRQAANQATSSMAATPPSALTSSGISFKLPASGEENDLDYANSRMPNVQQLQSQVVPLSSVRYQGTRIRDLQFVFPGGTYPGDYIEYIDPIYGFVAVLRNGQARLSSANGTLNYYGIPADRFFQRVRRGFLIYRTTVTENPRYLLIRWRPLARYNVPWYTHRAIIHPQPRFVYRPPYEGPWRGWGSSQIEQIPLISAKSASSTAGSTTTLLGAPSAGTNAALPNPRAADATAGRPVTLQ